MIRYCLAVMLMYYGCSSTKSTIHNGKSIPLKDEYVNLKVEKISDVTFEMVNHDLKKSLQNAKSDLKFDLSKNHPSPFAPTARTAFHWIVIEPDSFEISIVDTNGNFINGSLFKDFLPTGYYELTFINKNLGSGIYFIVLCAGNEEYYKKFQIIR